MQFCLAACTDRGKTRRVNQDGLLLQQALCGRKRYVLAAVCDGMGGLEKGELASSEVLRSLADWFQSRFPELLKMDELTVTTAESCTGGLVAARLVDVPGVSEVFKQGFITYSNKAKRKLLNVKKTTLKEFGAVSEKTAREMAKGAILASGADAAIATTGIAGPDGGTEEKPVGLVYIGVSVRGPQIIPSFSISAISLATAASSTPSITARSAKSTRLFFSMNVKIFSLIAFALPSGFL